MLPESSFALVSLDSSSASSKREGLSVGRATSPSHELDSGSKRAVEAAAGDEQRERPRGASHRGGRRKRASRLLQLRGAAHLELEGPPALAHTRPPSPDPARPDGSIAMGFALGPIAASACEAARLAPPPFASLRNEVDASEEELRLSPYPYDCYEPMQFKHPGRTATAAKRKRFPASVPGASTGDTHPPYAGVPVRPSGCIPIAALYLPGVYSARIESWLCLCDAAVADLRAGRMPRAVPVRVISQDLLQPWARGIVWDCSDPSDCVPVQRSTRHTAFPGKRQLDRDAVRKAAADLDWQDHDLVDQIGEGGVEVRSDCTFDTVLVFHHASFFDEFEAASGVIKAHIAEEWVSQPTRHLPFVPCRLQPRGVVMQSRTRVAESGVGLDEYLKPCVVRHDRLRAPAALTRSTTACGVLSEGWSCPLHRSSPEPGRSWLQRRPPRFPTPAR